MNKKYEIEKKYIYDEETYPNMFLICFKELETGAYYKFEISDRRNDIDKLYKFLYQPNLTLIGFNNLNFDYPVIHNTLLSHKRQWTAASIYREVKNIIAEEYSSIRDNEVKIKQIDLYKIWHYDNKNKATSLKWLEFAMRWKNLQDLPYPVGSILTPEQMQDVVDYCYNDVDATEQFYNISKKHIELRQFYTDHEQMNLINGSEIKISKEIFSKHLSKEMDMSQWDVKQLRTFRNTFPISNIVFPYIKYNDPVNIRSLETFNNLNWVDTSNMSKTEAKKHSVSFTVPYKNVTREYAEGGLHSFGKSGIYESDDDYILIDVDFASYYPHLSFRNNLHPEHIPEPIFSKIYEGFYKERQNYPKSDPRNYVLKIILNGSYGLSKDKYAFLYDPKWQMAICINGQLILTKLTELVFEHCIITPTIIFENTDGAMYRIHRSDINNLNKACKIMENICNIPLETQECQKIIARDVNNYINIIDSKNIKFKGCFEINRDYHKNHSKRIVPVALANYYINNVPIKETILNHFNTTEYNIPADKKSHTNIPQDKDYYQSYGIFDFCIGSKMKGSNKLFEKIIDKLEIIYKPLQKVNRYYVSKDGNEFIKKLPPLEKSYIPATELHKQKVDSNQMNIFDIVSDETIVDPKDRESNLEVGWKCTLFNNFIEKENYNINYDYYIKECNKILNKL